MGVSEDELHVFVDGVVSHYDELFHMKADAAKGDAFNLLYGSWKSPVERLFQWLGGFRPSEILYLQRRLAQNREAARKSRLKKKLAKLEHEIEKTRQQDAYMDLSNRVHGLLLGNINSGIVPFERKYDLWPWVVEQRKKESQLVIILQSGISDDDQLRVFVDGVVNHYDELFRMKVQK
ncbi:transcription factor TGA4-like protein [Tanacetum coccineum]